MSAARLPADAVLLALTALAFALAMMLAGCDSVHLPVPPQQIVPLPARIGCAPVRVDGTRCIVCQGRAGDASLACNFKERP